MRKRPELKAQVQLQFKDEPVLYQELIKLIILAAEIADMDDEASVKYQEIFLKNL